MPEYTSISEDIFTVSEFFTPAECNFHIQRCETAGFEDAPINTLGGAVIAKDVRNNTRAMIDDIDLAGKLWNRIREFVPEMGRWKASGLNERFRYYRYEPGQSFRWHRDGYFERERFKIEAKAAASLNHPNIATIFAIEEVDDDTFIVMEYIKGKELKELTTGDEKLSIEDVTNYATQIAEGLKAAHEEDVTHRDIKSANIMITDKGQVKIMDFGLAKVRGGAQVTKVGTTLGTAAYMSPEQARGEEADHRSDIWSFGVVLYEMLTGKLPFGGDYEQAVMYAIMNEEPEPISNLRPETPELLQEVVSRALAKDSSERFQTVEEVVNLLRRVSGQSDDARQLLDRPKQKGSKLSRRAIALLGVIFFVVAGSIYFFKASGEALDTLAILPLTNQSDDKEMEYLSDGISETLIFKLSQLPNLKVRSLSSVLRYKGTSPDLRKVGADLNVRAVLTGRVAVRNDRLAIVVELVDTRDNSTIWGNTYNRMLADLLTVQDEISSNILTRLQLELTGEALEKVDKHYTDNAEAYQAFLKGRYFIQNRTEENLRKALEYFQLAIDIEPNYAVAYAGLSEGYFLLWAYGFLSHDETLPKAKQAAEKALEIDNTLYEAHRSCPKKFSHC